jgi:hypothetical protein
MLSFAVALTLAMCWESKEAYTAERDGMQKVLSGMDIIGAFQHLIVTDYSDAKVLNVFCLDHHQRRSINGPSQTYN